MLVFLRLSWVLRAPGSPRLMEATNGLGYKVGESTIKKRQCRNEEIGQELTFQPPASKVTHHVVLTMCRKRLKRKWARNGFCLDFRIHMWNISTDLGLKTKAKNLDGPSLQQQRRWKVWIWSPWAFKPVVWLCPRQGCIVSEPYYSVGSYSKSVRSSGNDLLGSSAFSEVLILNSLMTCANAALVPMMSVWRDVGFGEQGSWVTSGKRVLHSSPFSHTRCVYPRMGDFCADTGR